MDKFINTFKELTGQVDDHRQPIEDTIEALKAAGQAATPNAEKEAIEQFKQYYNADSDFHNIMRDVIADNGKVLFVSDIVLSREGVDMSIPSHQRTEILKLAEMFKDRVHDPMNYPEIKAIAGLDGNTKEASTEEIASAIIGANVRKMTGGGSRCANSKELTTDILLSSPEGGDDLRTFRDKMNNPMDHSYAEEAYGDNFAPEATPDAPKPEKGTGRGGCG